MEGEWRRIETLTGFLPAFADKLLLDDGVSFVIHADGRISGEVIEGRRHEMRCARDRGRSSATVVVIQQTSSADF